MIVEYRNKKCLIRCENTVESDDSIAIQESPDTVVEILVESVGSIRRVWVSVVCGMLHEWKDACCTHSKEGACQSVTTGMVPICLLVI